MEKWFWFCFNIAIFAIFFFLVWFFILFKIMWCIFFLFKSFSFCRIHHVTMRLVFVFGIYFKSLYLSFHHSSKCHIFAMLLFQLISMTCYEFKQTLKLPQNCFVSQFETLMNCFCDIFAVSWWWWWWRCPAKNVTIFDARVC